jgi:hypothetical protein
MSKNHNGGLKKVLKDIRREAVKQIGGFPDDMRRQALGGWGHQFARQILGTTK